MSEELNPIRIYTQALKYAIEADHIDVIKALINYVDVNMQYESEFDRATTFLIDAVRKNKKNIVELLLKNKTDVNIQDSTRNTALIYATINNYIDIVNLLLENDAQILKKNVHGQSALSISIDNNKNDIIKIFIEKGCDVNDITQQTNADLLIKAVKNNNKEVVKQLLDLNISVRELSGGKSPLIYAIENNNEEIVKMLLSQSTCYIDYPNRPSGTPLHYAVKKGNDNIIKMLLEKGAKTDLIEALKYISKENRVEFINSCKINDVINILKEYYEPEITSFIEINISYLSQDNQTIFNNYLSDEQKKMNKEKKDKQIQIEREKHEQKRIDEQNKLKEAQDKQPKPLAKVIDFFNQLINKIDINEEDNKKILNENLYKAVDECDYDQIKKLIKKGADINYKKNGKPLIAIPLRISQQPNQNVCNLTNTLLDLGAKYDSSIDELWRNAQPDVQKLLKKRWKIKVPFSTSEKSINSREGTYEKSTGNMGYPNNPYIHTSGSWYSGNEKSDDED